MDKIKNKSIEDIKLTDLLDVQILQKVQDEFSDMALMAALITDENGVPITVGRNFSRLCTDFCRKSEIGEKRCEECDKMGAVTALEQRAPVYYYCHANLIDFAAPIMLSGRMIGCFIGGQILSRAPDPDKMRKVARELGVDEEQFVKAANETRVVPVSAIDRSTKFIYGYAEVLSEMAYTAYVAKRKSEEALQAVAAKSDFLANMSHEIRTPLNAIIGMAQIGMREEMSDAARKCMEQITSSGKILLAIINDVLDYSKMESGKMTLAGSEYETLALIKDIASIIVNRIGDKKIELILDVDPSIPRVLHGDDIRIKQMVINLANNAVKFTNKGYVAIRIGYGWTGSDEITLKCRVEDTGIGIKKEALPKLFNSFEQVDSKRNREIEGTGLGLAIVKNLVEMMGGRLFVETEYEKGSTFSFEIPQKVADDGACIPAIDDCPCVIGLISNPYIKPELKRDVERIGALYVEAGSEDDLQELVEKTDARFLFVSENLLSEKLLQTLRQYENLTVVRCISIGTEAYEEIPGVRTIRKPLYSMNVAALLRDVDLEISSGADFDEELDFVAPDANILIVDDNEVNLTVTKGLLEPLDMQLDTATSGVQAIGMTTDKLYDLILMDHMMPEMDGIEATHRIRELQPAYENIPIIALSANAVRGTLEMFLNSGMDDFVAKPIDLKLLAKKIKKCLPREKIKPVDPKKTAHSEEKEAKKETVSIPGLDTEYALHLLGSMRLFWQVLRDYYRVIDGKYDLIKRYETEENWQEYCIEVHALKSASRQIGAVTLADKAERLELAAADLEAEFIHDMTDDMLADYRRIQETIAPFCEEQVQTEVKPITSEILAGFLQNLSDALGKLDLGALESIFDKMKTYRYPEESEMLLNYLGTAIENIDTEAAEQIIREWQELI